MSKKQKVTFTLYIDGNESPDELAAKLLHRRIKSLAIIQAENMSAWARELGVSRQFVNQVVSGEQKNQRVRDFIEERLGQKFWSEEGVTDGATAQMEK